MMIKLDQDILRRAFVHQACEPSSNRNIGELKATPHLLEHNCANSHAARFEEHWPALIGNK